MEEKKQEIIKTDSQITLFDLNSIDGLDKFKAKKGEQISGLEILDRSDYKLPKWRLIQSSSLESQKGKCPAGYFYNTITEEYVEQLSCNLLVLGKSRVMWKKPFKRGEDPLCYSLDSKVKYDKSVLCEGCEFGDWKKKEKGETKPPCNMSYVWLGVTPNNQPFKLIAGGANVSVTKSFLNVIVPIGYPSFIYNVVLSSEQKENDKGVFFVIKYNIINVVDPKRAEELEELSVGLENMFMSSMEVADIKDTADTESNTEDAPF